MGLNTTPRTWVAGEKPPASTWNTEIRDAFTGIQAAWTSYTPTLTNVTLGTGGTVQGWYHQIGHTIRFRALITPRHGRRADGWLPDQHPRDRELSPRQQQLPRGHLVPARLVGERHRLWRVSHGGRRQCRRADVQRDRDDLE